MTSMLSAKTLLPNQCVPLHFLYGANDCCICRANQRIAELEKEVEQLRIALKVKEDLEKLGGVQTYLGLLNGETQ